MGRLGLGGGAVDGLVRTVGSSGRRGWSVLIRCNIDIHYIYNSLRVVIIRDQLRHVASEGVRIIGT
jgi:hypothetical protein